jgi:hypothetical protein
MALNVALQETRIRYHIRVHEHDEICRGQPGAQITCSSSSSIVLPKKAQRERQLQRGDELGSVIERAIVDDQNFKITGG